MTKYVLFESGGGKVDCGEYAGEREDGRIRAIVGGVVPVVAFKEENKLTPHELCKRHNVLLDEVERLRAENERLTEATRYVSEQAPEASLEL